MVITPVSPLSSVVPSIPVTPSALSGGKSPFHSVFQDAVQNVENFRADAENKVNSFLSGETDEVHDVVMSAQRAELSFELFQGVRNKVVQAYQEIMRMQL